MSTANLMDLPAMAPPPGVQPQFENPPNQNGMALAVISVCFAISSLAALLRYYSKWVAGRKFQIPDYLLLVTLGIYTSIVVIYIRLVGNPGWYIHMWDLHVAEMIEFMRVSMLTTNLFLALLIPTKTAILVEWIHMFLPVSGRESVFFWACHFVIWANIVYTLVTLLLVNLSCVPYEYLWNRTIPGGHCRINTAYTSLSAACFAFSTDVIILFIPQRIIWTLHMSRSRKLGVSVVFALGAAACAAAIIRLYYTIGRAESADLTYHLSVVQLTAIGEIACVILVLCVPTFPKAIHSLKHTGLVSSMLSWSSLASVVRHRSSKQSLENNADGVARSWPPSIHKNRRISSQIDTASERQFISLQPLPNVMQHPNAMQHDPELGNSIIRTTTFEANEGYKPASNVAEQGHMRQHPWIQE